MLHPRQTKRDTTVAGRWYNELGSLLQHLGTKPQVYFSDADLRCLGICVSSLNLKDAHSTYQAAPPHTQPSNSERKKRNTDPYSLSRDLKAAISQHEAAAELVYPSGWRYLKYKTQVLRHRQASRGNGGWSGLSIKVPILLISILNPARACIVQGCFDGILKLQRSRLYGFDGPFHAADMDLFIRWMKGRPCGKTCLGASCVVPECEERYISRLGWKT
ncbi:hypothetical protein PHISP_06158 [Aspergillus sp. HF37]|nr:hypothetical protein PHISP_06158 [Aspergillus sp. HF37]